MRAQQKLERVKVVAARVALHRGNQRPSVLAARTKKHRVRHQRGERVKAAYRSYATAASCSSWLLRVAASSMSMLSLVPLPARDCGVSASARGAIDWARRTLEALVEVVGERVGRVRQQATQHLAKVARRVRGDVLGQRAPVEALVGLLDVLKVGLVRLALELRGRGPRLSARKRATAASCVPPR